MSRSAHSLRAESCLYSAVAYDDEPVRLEKPAGVSDVAWKARLGDYAAALVLYKRAAAAIGDAIRAGQIPTQYQRGAEDNARELLTITRTALLDLCRSPLGSD